MTVLNDHEIEPLENICHISPIFPKLYTQYTPYPKLTSLVGAIINEEGRPTLLLLLPTASRSRRLLPRPSNNIFCKSGKPNMMVFPLPVALLAMTSYPLSGNNSGIAADCIGVGVVMFIHDWSVCTSDSSNDAFEDWKLVSGDVP